MDALSSQRSRSILIAKRLFLMLSAVQFDRQLQVMRVEIQNEILTPGFNRMLAAEFGVGQAAVPQQVPDQLFGVGLF